MTLWNTIIGILHGILQFGLYLIPLIKPLVEAVSPPAWWYRYWSWSDWHDNLDSENRPNQQWIEKWLHGCYFELERNIVSTAARYSDELADTLRWMFGVLPSGFNTFANWISTIENLLGIYKPAWALNAMHGLVKLYNWLPEEVRTGIKSWASLFDAVVALARAWALSYYRSTVEYALSTWNWVVSQGNALVSWWNAARGVLDQFRSNPYGFIVARLGTGWSWLLAFRANARNWVQSWLGEPWIALVSWAAGPLTFYYNLWGRNAAMLGEFLSDPLEFLYSHVEDFLNEKVG